MSQCFYNTFRIKSLINNFDVVNELSFVDFSIFIASFNEFLDE